MLSIIYNCCIIYRKLPFTSLLSLFTTRHLGFRTRPQRIKDPLQIIIGFDRNNWFFYFLAKILKLKSVKICFTFFFFHSELHCQQNESVTCIFTEHKKLQFQFFISLAEALFPSENFAITLIKKKLQNSWLKSAFSCWRNYPTKRNCFGCNEKHLYAPNSTIV